MLLLLAHATATLLMTGVIWFVQVVHYPLFALVGPAAFARYEQLHAARTTWVVAPLMLAELATAVLLLTRPDDRLPAWMPVTGLVLLAVIWGSTFLLQVPRHDVLAAGFDAGAHQALVASNWIRTTARTLRAGLALWMLTRV